MRVQLLYCLLLSLPLTAQTPFANVGAQWTGTQGNCCPDTTAAEFPVLSDTVLQGRTCYTLQRAGISLVQLLGAGRRIVQHRLIVH